MKRQSGLVVALDMKDQEKALHVAHEVSHVADAFKVNYPLILSNGMDVVGRLSKIKPVICDFKIADIPYTNELISEIAFTAGASAVIAHPFVGTDSFRACVDVAERYGGEVIGVVSMSHPGSTEIMSSLSKKLADIVRSSGGKGMVAPGTRPEEISAIRTPGIQIYSPGIGVQGGKASSAFDAGADFIIIGRAITDSNDPYNAARRFLG